MICQNCGLSVNYMKTVAVLINGKQKLVCKLCSENLAGKIGIPEKVNLP
jgi:hypothetical protein